MSDNSISIVPKLSSYPNNILKAKEILEWLISRDIVKPTLSDCILNPNKKGYSVSNGAKIVTESAGYSKIEFDKKGNITETPIVNYIPIDLLTNGLEIITERHIFDTGENFIEELICPKCFENIAFDDWDLTPWAENVNDNLTCTQCNHQAEIHLFTFEPNFGFSNLGFTFWNWPEFKPEFIEEFKNQLNCDTSVVHSHL